MCHCRSGVFWNMLCSVLLSAYRRVVAGWSVFFFQAEDGIRDLVRSRGLGDVYKRQVSGLLTRRKASPGSYLPSCWVRGASSERKPSSGLSLIHI